MLNRSYENETADLYLISKSLKLDFNNHTLLITNRSLQNSTSLPTIDSYVDRHVIGMALALCGNLLISISLNVQKKAHNRLGQESQLNYCVDKWWWLGMILMGLGEWGNFMAYGFAPASLVAPLGSLGVIANAIIAVVFLHEPLTMSSMMGVTFVIVGSVILVSFSVKGKPVLTSAEIILYLQAWPFVVYLSVEIFVLVILLYLKYVRGKEQMVILLLLVAIVASVTIIAAKAVSTMITETIIQKKDHVLNPVFFISLAIIPVTTFTQIRFLNRAMQLYNVSDVVPVNFMFFTTSAILAGVMFYKEFYNVQFDHIFMFLFGVVQSIIGVYIITKENGVGKKKEQDNSEKRDINHVNNASRSSECNNDGEVSKALQKVTENHKEAFSGEKTSASYSPGGSKASNVDLNHKTNAPASNILSNLLRDLLEDMKSSEEISRVQPLAKDTE